jgi:hypothetical protein
MSQLFAMRLHSHYLLFDQRSYTTLLWRSPALRHCDMPCQCMHAQLPQLLSLQLLAVQAPAYEAVQHGMATLLAQPCNTKTRGKHALCPIGPLYVFQKLVQSQEACQTVQ